MDDLSDTQRKTIVDEGLQVDGLKRVVKRESGNESIRVIGDKETAVERKGGNDEILA